jgi:hypothetical protein
MSHSFIIVTAADEAYAALLGECLRSIRDKPQGRDVPLGVVDCGLSRQSLDFCHKLGARVITSAGRLPEPATGPIDVKRLQALTSRAYLPDLFPGYTTYIWIDADAWLQEWFPVDELIAGSAEADIAAVPEIHRGYRNYREAWDEFRSVNGAAAKEAYGAETAKLLMQRPLINAGAFAISAKSPIWAGWDQALREGLGRSTNMIDQVALNYAVYVKGYADARLPAKCNWLVHQATPKLRPSTGRFVEPDRPFEAIGLMHLTLGTKWAQALPVSVVGTGEVRQMSVRYAMET